VARLPTGIASPRLELEQPALVANPHPLVDDFALSLEAHPLPPRAFEHSDEFTIGITEAGAELDAHEYRIGRSPRSSAFGRTGGTPERASVLTVIVGVSADELPDDVNLPRTLLDADPKHCPVPVGEAERPGVRSVESMDP
jgi:hypothetical protein